MSEFPTVSPSPNPPDPRRARPRAVLAGALLAMVLAALDQNIVNTALPRIVADLGGLAHLSWVVTAFMLTATITTTLYGRLSDLHGRKPLFFVAIGLFVVDLFAPTHGILTAGGVISFFLGTFMLFDRSEPFLRLSIAWILPATVVTRAGCWCWPSPPSATSSARASGRATRG